MPKSNLLGGWWWWGWGGGGHGGGREGEKDMRGEGMRREDRREGEEDEDMRAKGGDIRRVDEKRVRRM